MYIFLSTLNVYIGSCSQISCISTKVLWVPMLSSLRYFKTNWIFSSVGIWESKSSWLRLFLGTNLKKEQAISWLYARLQTFYGIVFNNSMFLALFRLVFVVIYRQLFSVACTHQSSQPVCVFKVFTAAKRFFKEYAAALLRFLRYTKRTWNDWRVRCFLQYNLNFARI